MATTMKRVDVELTAEEKLRSAINVALHHIALAYREAGMLPAPISDAKQVLEAALVVRRTIKLSGNMVDCTDRDLAGNPTLEGNCL